MIRRPEYSSSVANVIRHLPPERKRIVKAAIIALSENPLLGLPLMRELQGLWKYRVDRYRIVYSFDRSVLRVVAVGHRRRIYDDLTAHGFERGMKVKEE